jgi:hypothetical protein
MSSVITPDLLPEFPNNVVEELKVSLEELEGVDVVLRRPLKPTDPNGSAGVFAGTWTPQEMVIGQHDPAVTRYSVVIQTFVKHGNEEEGVVLHSQLAKRVRVMLYRDPELRVRLGTLSTDEDGVRERLQRWGVTTQRYLSNEIQNNFLFLAVTELWIETELV